MADAAHMARLLRHRGPDDNGEWVDPSGRVAFAFRRLAILDLSPAGRQPMSSPSGRYTMVFNGEVFNFEALRAEVGAPRNGYRGGSDTEVLLTAFDRLGVQPTLKRMIGMFAIALWDQESDELWLVRDRLGIKPLYVARTACGLAFGSELGALTRAPGFDATLDLAAISSYLRYLFIPAPGTPFLGVRKVPPGHVLRIKDPCQTLPPAQPFWTLTEARARGEDYREHPPTDRTESEAIDALDRLLSDAVRLRMVADVPVGALLSGGIDSSLIVALMQEHSSRPVRTFTVGFDHPEHDESLHARAVAEHLGTDHTELRVTGEEALGLVSSLPRIFDEPLADPSQIPTYLVSALARRSVTVALSGDGGDELFAGYNRYRSGPAVARRLARIPSTLRSWLGAALRSVPAPAWDRFAELGIGKSPGPRLAGQKVHKLGRIMQQSTGADSYRTLLSVWDHPHVFLTANCGPRTDPLLDMMNRSPDPLSLDEMLELDQKYYLPDDLLQKVDRASMAVSLEIRVPLLDHRVVEESWRLTNNLKLRGDQGKWALRMVLDRRVPRALTERPKTGFSVPVEDWLMGPLRGWCEDLLLSRSPVRDALLNPRELRKVWRSFIQGRTELGLGIWSLAMLEAWRTHWKIENITEDMRVL